MNRIRYRIMEFMRGRNGMDFLNKVLFGVILVLDIVSIITRLRMFYSLFLIVSVIFFYRFFSRNIMARQRENNAFMKFIRINKRKFDERDSYKYFKCKGCGKNVRVPKGKGRIEVTCPVCGNKRIIRT